MYQKLFRAKRGFASANQSRAGTSRDQSFLSDAQLGWLLLITYTGCRHPTAGPRCAAHTANLHSRRVITASQSCVSTGKHCSAMYATHNDTSCSYS